VGVQKPRAFGGELVQISLKFVLELAEEGGQVFSFTIKQWQVRESVRFSRYRFGVRSGRSWDRERWRGSISRRWGGLGSWRTLSFYQFRPGLSSGLEGGSVLFELLLDGHYFIIMAGFLLSQSLL
jgi:hypothetical protein